MYQGFRAFKNYFHNELTWTSNPLVVRSNEKNVAGLFSLLFL